MDLKTAKKKELKFSKFTNSSSEAENERKKILKRRHPVVARQRHSTDLNESVQLINGIFVIFHLIYTCKVLYIYTLNFQINVKLQKR